MLPHIHNHTSHFDRRFSLKAKSEVNTLGGLNPTFIAAARAEDTLTLPGMAVDIMDGPPRRAESEEGALAPRVMDMAAMSAARAAAEGPPSDTLEEGAATTSSPASLPSPHLDFFRVGSAADQK